ncbi:MAG: glycosyltransferase family 39 protein [Candidatus Polarisedimenticolia bacterium]
METGRSRRRLLLYLLLAGLLARVVYQHQVAALPFFQDPVGDSARHLERAREILAGNLLPDRPFFYGGILYPWVLAAFALVFGANLYPVVLAQALAGCLLSWLLYRLAVACVPPGRRRAGRRAGMIAAALALFYGPLAFLEADILMVSWTLPALAMAGILLLRACRKGRDLIGPAGAAGLLLALAATERPNLVALLPVGAVWIAAAFPARARLRGAACLLGASALVLAPVAWMNHAASGRWVLLTTSGGINFSIGNHPGARGTFEEPWSADTHATARDTDLESASQAWASRGAGSPLDAVETSRWWWAQGWSWVRSAPAAAGRLAARKLALLWNDQEPPNHLHFAFLRETAPALWLMPITFAWIAPAGLYGLLWPGPRRGRDQSATALLALLVAVPMMTVLPFFVADRYRIAMVPPLMVCAGFGLERLGRLARIPGGRTWAAGSAAAMVVAGWILARPLLEFDRSRDYWMMAQAWKKAGALEEAVSGYGKAIALAPDDAVLRNNLGVLLAGMGRVPEAEQEYRRAIALDPSLAFPHKNLGLLLARTGRREEALVHLAKARESEPQDREILQALEAMGETP